MKEGRERKIEKHLSSESLDSVRHKENRRLLSMCSLLHYIEQVVYFFSLVEPCVTDTKLYSCCLSHKPEAGAELCSKNTPVARKKTLTYLIVQYGNLRMTQMCIVLNPFPLLKSYFTKTNNE